MQGNQILDKMLKIHKINVYSNASELGSFFTSLNLICLFITYILKMTFEGNIRGRIDSTALHLNGFHTT